MIIIVNNGKIKVINEEDKLIISRLLNKSENFNIKMLNNVIQYICNYLYYMLIIEKIYTLRHVL